MSKVILSHGPKMCCEKARPANFIRKTMPANFIPQENQTCKANLVQKPGLQIPSRRKMQDARCKMPDARCKMQDVRCKIQVARGKMQDARCKMPDARCKMQDARCKLLHAWRAQRGDFFWILHAWSCCADNFLVVACLARAARRFFV